MKNKPDRYSKEMAADCKEDAARRKNGSYHRQDQLQHSFCIPARRAGGLVQQS